MGRLEFLVHPPDRLSDDALASSYFAGSDSVPWKGVPRRTAEGFVVERSVTDSGNLHVLWPTASRGPMVLSTATLMERPRPYHLEVELARGKINQLRNQLSDWVHMGLSPPDAVREQVRQAIELFSHAATGQHQPDDAARRAEQAIDAALQASDALAHCYTDQALAARHRQHAQLNTLLGVNLGHAALSEGVADRLRRLCNAAIVPINWRLVEAREGSYDWQCYDQQLEWCRQNGVRAIGGPLLQLDRAGLPDWLSLWEGDFDNLQSLVTDFVRQAVTRYQGQVRVWQCAARLHHSDGLELVEEERLRLVVQVVETTREVDPNTPIVVSFDQPWAEYLNRVDFDLSPLHVGDALVRAGLGLAGFGLEINVGPMARGSLPRDLIEVSRLVDRWSSLGLPLMLHINCPSSDEPDAQARWSAPPTGWTPHVQREWVEEYASLLLAKPAVHGVFWNQLSDAGPHDAPHGGLFDAQQQPKPALDTLIRLRAAHLS